MRLSAFSWQLFTRRLMSICYFFFSSRRRHTRYWRDWSSDVCSSDLTVPPIEEYLGEEILERIERVLGGRRPEVIGRFTQVLPNNWKLYVENVRDSYHASLLHLFFTTFELNKLSQKGGLIVSESGGNRVSYSAI